MHSKRIVLTVMAVLAGLQLSGSAWAQDEVDNTIEPQPLTKALAEFAEQTGMQLVYPSELTAGVDSKGASAEGSPGEILDELLASTGLEYEYVNDRTIAIAAQTSANVSVVEGRDSGQGGGSDSKNWSPAPILMAQNTSPTATSPESSEQSNSGGTSVVTGRVTDARTGANLKGARVAIEETGQWTSTNVLGEFRFASVPTGNATLTVSFLGYAGQSAVIGVRGDSVEQDFTLRGGSELEEIVVFGQRSARALALNQERTAQNFTTVLAADLLGQFSGTTIAEALRRAPGIAFEIDPETGDGANVIVRGLEPDFNQIQFNSVRLAEGSGLGRSPDLSNILAESIESVTVNKTLLPSQDGSGTGALIEIKTRSPLDRDRRFASLAYEYNERGGGFGHDRLASTTLSGIFGENDDWGASLSVQLRDTSVTRIGHDLNLTFGQYLPQGISALRDIDPITPFPFEAGVDEAYPTSSSTTSATRDSENLTAIGTLQKQIGSHTDLRFDYTFTQVETMSFNQTASQNSFGSYQLVLISELDGAERYAWITERPSTGPFPGVLARNTQSVSFTPNAETENTVISIGGETAINSWSFDYGAGYSNSETYGENLSFGIELNRDFWINELLSESDFRPEVASNQRGGLIVSAFEPIAPGVDPGLVFPGYNEAYFDRVNNVDNYSLATSSASRFIRLSGDESQNERFSLSASARRNFSPPWLEYIEVGAFVERSETSRNPIESNGQRVFYRVPALIPLSAVGLEFGPGILDAAGIGTSGFDLLTRQSVTSLLPQLEGFAASGLLTRGTIDFPQAEFDGFNREDEFAAYLEAQINWGRLEIIGGARLVRVDVESAAISKPRLTLADGSFDPDFEDRFTQIVTLEASQTDILPRVLANYRFNEDLVLRAGYFNTVARPQINQLDAGQSANLILLPVFGPNGDQPLLIVTQGNPDLRPSYTHNFDASMQWFTDDIGILTLSVFYKEIQDPFNFLNFEGGLELDVGELVLPDAPEFNNLPDNIFIQVNRPINAEDDIELWGAEFAIERRFNFLPNFWSGFGVYGNFTYSDSSQTVRFDTDSNPTGFVELETRLPGSPRYSGTAAITYDRFGIDTSLVYTWQDRRLSRVEDFGLDEFDSEFDSLDFRIAYNGDIQGRDFTVFFEANDLLRDSNEARVQREVGGVRGTPTYHGVNSQFHGGRNIVVGGRVNF